MFVVVCNLFSIVSISKGSEAENKIASTCLSNFVGVEGKLKTLFFFLPFYIFLIITLSNFYPEIL